MDRVRGIRAVCQPAPHEPFRTGSDPAGMVPPMARVLIVDPQPAARAGLAMLLRAEPGLVPVGTATGARDGADLAARRKPDVVLMEHRLPDGDGLALTRRLRVLEHPPQVILYTAEPEPSLGLQARVAGAAGLIDKHAEP